MSSIGWRLPLLFGVALAGAACDGDDEGGDDSSETGEIDPKGGFSVNVTSAEPSLPNLGGRTCPAQGMVGLGSPPPTGTMAGGLAKTGDAGASVICVVAQEGATYRADLIISIFSQTPEEKALGAISNDIDPANGSMLAGITFRAPTIGTLSAVSSDPCNMAPVHEVAPGTLWADFDCPMLVGEDDTTACAVSGTVEFRGCLKGTEF